jgi:endonuclease-3
MAKREAKHPDTRPEWFPGGEAASTGLLGKAVPKIREAIRGAEDPSVTAIAKKTRSPFRVLVSTVISARTKDEVTGAASVRLFSRADNPRDMARLTESEIAKLIYPAGFYKTKARAIHALSRQLIEDFAGEVPEKIGELLELPGVGRKTANLVVTLAFGNPGICVDTHVHRIVNRIGAVRTKNPKETEFALRSVLPERHWIEINDLLVMYGKEVCTPVSPKCSICALPALCGMVGVIRSR